MSNLFLHYQALFRSPQQLVNIEYRPILTHPEIAFNSLLDTTQTSSQTTSHHVLKRSFAVNAIGLGIPCHSLHHRFWPTRLDNIELLVPQDGMIGYKSLFSLRLVFSGNVNIAYLLEKIQLQQILGSLAPKRKESSDPSCLNLLPCQRSGATPTPPPTSNTFLWKT